MIKDVTDLDVYNESFNLLASIYELIKKFPSSEYNLRNQIKRSAQSVPANIAEGFAKRFSEKEFKRFLLIAIGSSDETITHLRIIAIAMPKLDPPSQQLFESYKVLSKRLNTLHKTWCFGRSS